MVITNKTTLSQLQLAGAQNLADIPIIELLQFVRNTCITLGKEGGDVGLLPEGWEENFSNAAQHLQASIEAIETTFGSEELYT